MLVFPYDWELDTAAAEIRGQGSYFDFNRKRMEKGLLEVGMDSIVLYEANRLEPGIESKRLVSLLVLSYFHIPGTVACVLNPKACFGSCPTFYTGENKTVHEAAAEGFSSAILPSLEYADVDDLDTVATGKEFSLYMKNEALETHVVRSAHLLALPCREREPIYQGTGDTFYAGTSLQKPSQARRENGASILPEVQALDKKAYFSPADSHDFQAPEELFFEVPLKDLSGDSLGLVLDFRQSLMTTYFIYSALSYMETEATDYLSRKEVEFRKRTAKPLEIMKKLGGIEAFVYDEREEEWQRLGEFYETGPIAINRQVIPFPHSAKGAALRLKLRLNKGLWRINRIGLTDIHRAVNPIVIAPQEVIRKGRPQPAERGQLKDSAQHLISLPGQVRELRYRIPTQRRATPCSSAARATT